MPVTEKNSMGKTAKQRRILLLCLSILCLAVLLINDQQPRATYAVAAVPPEAPQTGEAYPAQVDAAKTGKSDKLAAIPSIWPVHGRITSGYGWRNSPFENGSELHAGIDIAINAGVPVVATADGQIVQSGPAGGYGNMVQIDHGNGISTIYGHNSQLNVSVGEAVKKGQVVSFAGSTGKSTGPHVHYEVRENGKVVDPWKYLIFHKQLVGKL